MTSPSNPYILDCTLRDGGYVNNWAFSNSCVCRTVHALTSAGIDIVECGFISQTKGQKDGTQFASLDLAEQHVAKALEKEKATHPLLCCVMINFGEYKAADLPPCSSTAEIQGIRLAFHKKDRCKARSEAEIILSKGYKLFVQPMVTVSYSDAELLNLIDSFNLLDIYAMYIVDSFGSMSREDFKRFVYLFDHNVREGIVLGYHSHNNLQLAYSNAIDFIDFSQKRQICIDSSIFGMGRGAGNLNTELLADFLNQHASNPKYKIVPLLEVMDSFLEAEHRRKPWGYSMAHFLSASRNCHPNYATFLLSKKSLSLVSILDILDRLDLDKRINFDAEYAAELYQGYKHTCMIKPTVGEDFLTGHSVLLLASGPNARIEEKAIKTLIKDLSLTVVAVNHVPENIQADYYFFSNQKRYDEFVHLISTEKFVATSNLLLHSKHLSAMIASYEKLHSMFPQDCENVAALLLALLTSSKHTCIWLAGLDGYDPSAPAMFSYEERAGLLDQETMKQENRRLGEVISFFGKKVKLIFVTSSIFQPCLPLRVCGVIPARYQSTRFEGKPLALIDGVPMIKRTYDQAKKSDRLDSLVVATDSPQIHDYCQTVNIPVVMTSDRCKTGTDRVAEVAQQMNYDLYVNVQGDEPVISPETIDQIVDAYRQYGDKYIAYNLFKGVDENKENPIRDTVIKVIVNEENELMYMSRHPVPFSKSGMHPSYNKQVCVYGFTPKALKEFARSPKTRNEQYEDIEILRFLDLGYKVFMIETDYDSIAVDTPEDITLVEAFLLDKQVNLDAR